MEMKVQALPSHNLLAPQEVTPLRNRCHSPVWVYTFTTDAHAPNSTVLFCLLKTNQLYHATVPSHFHGFFFLRAALWTWEALPFLLLRTSLSEEDAHPFSYTWAFACFLVLLPKITRQYIFFLCLLIYTGASLLGNISTTLYRSLPPPLRPHFTPM